MIESIHRYFKIGIVQFMAYPSALKGECPEIITNIKKIACDDYFDAIEISWIKDIDTRKKVKSLLQSSKLEVCYGAQPRLLTTGMNANHLVEKERLKAEVNLKEAVDEAHEMGARGVGFLSGKFQKQTIEESYSQLLKTTRNVCDYAKSKGITINLEVFDFDIAKESLIGPAPLAARFAAEMRTTHSNFGLMTHCSCWSS